MAEEIILSNMSDDSEIKKYINEQLMPRVFHDVPLNNLNTGLFSIINEYMSQGMEQLAFTSSFYFNESFITKSVLPESVFAEAAIFNIGYSFATPSACAFLLELKIDDIKRNAVENPNNGLMEFVLDKDTKFNLSNGNVYSLDYDILIQYTKTDEPAWNVQYTNTGQFNMCAINKNEYILYRVTDTWLCLYIQASEYERTKYVVVNNMMNGIANPDKVISCTDHICGFDITYVDSEGNRNIIPHDHLLPINSTVPDLQPYVHYIMDNPNTIRFKFQLNGDRYFIPDSNSSYEIIIYSCHGAAANFTGYNNMEQPQVITAANKYSNNSNVLKAGFVISPSMGGSDIGTTETVRRETIEAYNTAKVISTDHDIEEWFKTFYFKNILYPFFFKRRDDPWGRVWAGFLALKDTDNYIFRTNTLFARVPYEILYNNNDNTINGNEIIIPPGWIWTYVPEGEEGERFTVMPYTQGDGVTVEQASTLANISEKFVFSNPFGIRIQKEPFAMGYFNPWINDTFTATHLSRLQPLNDYTDDVSYIYHATPIQTNIKRTYKENFYRITTWISPTSPTWLSSENGVEKQLVEYLRKNVVSPIFSTSTWNYFVEPVDLYAQNIPLLPLLEGNGYIPFKPTDTYLCCRKKNKMDDDTWTLEDVWIEDRSESTPKNVYIPITGEITRLYGDDETWGENGYWNGYEVYVSGSTDIGIYPDITPDKHIVFSRSEKGNYYTLKLDSDAMTGQITKMVVSEAITSNLLKYDETMLVKIGKSYAVKTVVNIYFADQTVVHYEISNAANIYTPYEFTHDPDHDTYVFELDQVGKDGIILYADMKPSPSSGAIDYYRIPFNKFKPNKAAYYVENSLLPMDKNNMRVILHTLVNGSETGYVEMQPIMKENDGSYQFETIMYPLNQLVDVDNRILISSEDYGGGSWINNKKGSVVSIDATNPELKMSILVRSEHPDRDSEITIGDSFTGFRIVDQYSLDNVSLVQELKEMRSVVNFGDSAIPSEEQLTLYHDFLSLNEYNGAIVGNLWNIRKWAHDVIFEIENDTDLSTLKNIAMNISPDYNNYVTRFLQMFDIPIDDTPAGLKAIRNDVINTILHAETIEELEEVQIYDLLNNYNNMIYLLFKPVNVDGGMTVQLVPMVEYTLMNNERFESFVASFTQVHKAIEPVIFNRLEGNNYLDCKLIATYGLPHSYTSDIDPSTYWPSLQVKVEFDCHLFNVNMTTNTLVELKQIIREYFNRLTRIHTAADVTSMDNNIYVSHIIQQMESHNNVAYCRFKGWYTDEKNIENGSYMDANYQGIIQKYKSIDDFSKKDLESYVPEMYVLSDDDIIINII